MKREFILGEEKMLDFEVKSKSGQMIIISSASFELKHNGKTVQEGKMDIDGQKLHCLIRPTATGNMYLEIKYVIAPEIRKARIEIDVI